MDRGGWWATVHGVTKTRTWPNTCAQQSLSENSVKLPCFTLKKSIVFLYTNFFLFYFTILYWFCHTSTWIRHGCTRVPNPEHPSHLPPHTISLGHLSAPAPSTLYPASNLDWRFVSYMILYMFQCHYPKSSHPLPFGLPQSPKDCSIHLSTLIFN